MRRKGRGSIIFGIVFFVARYIPAINQKNFLMDRWVSVFDYSNSCNKITELVMQNCGIIKTIDTVLIVLAIIFFVHGLYELFQK